MLDDRAEQIDLGLEAPTSILPVRILKRSFNGYITFLKRKPMGGVGAAIVLLAIVIAIFAPLIAPHDPQSIGVAQKFSGPVSYTHLTLPTKA